MSKAQIEFTEKEEKILIRIKKAFDLKNKEQATKKAIDIAKDHLPS